MQAFRLAELLAERRQSQRLYLEFLRLPTLSVGIYELAAGGDDPQKPHSEDEVYYVLGGKASFRLGDQDQLVEPGTILLVKASVEHRFHTILEDLTLLVFFAPAETSSATKS